MFLPCVLTLVGNAILVVANVLTCDLLLHLMSISSCRELQPYDEPTCRAACYDYSSQYLAVGGTDLRVYAPKQVRQGERDIMISSRGTSAEVAGLVVCGGLTAC